MLTKDNKRLSVFDNGVVIDQNLPKWKNAAVRAKERAEAKASTRIVSRSTIQDENGNVYTNMDTPFTVYSTPEPYEVKESVDFDKVASATIRELTEMIKGNELNNILSGYGGMHGWGNTINSITWDGGDTRVWKKISDGPTLGSKIVNFFTKKKEPKPEFDIIEFFTLIKNASKESASVYVDRVSKYLQAIHNAKTAGQVSLLETLLSQMIANKYEAQLFAEGFYYAVDEKMVVDFAKKTEKGLSLTYLKNFNRPLPQEVVDMITKVNGFEVFDNYMVLHYDPEGTVYKETKKEEAKRKDPILFGVIAGSNKLYYITDWIDEYCDLTLEKFVDTLGIDKEDLNLDEEAGKSAKESKKNIVKTEEKKKKTTKSKKRNKKTE